MKLFQTTKRSFIFGSLFKPKRIGGCEKQEEILRVYQKTVIDQLPLIELVSKGQIDHQNYQNEDQSASIQFLISTLLNCQKLEIRDKFFYDTILEQIEKNLPSIWNPNLLIQLGIGLGINKDFQSDHSNITKKLYAHCYGHRFLFQKREKDIVNSIFQNIEQTRILSTHLDLFKPQSKDEIFKLAISSVFRGQQPPEFIQLNFDMENKVVIILNKKSQQKIILYGSYSIQAGMNQANTIKFGQSLMDQFNSQTLILNQKPLRVESENQILQKSINNFEPQTYEYIRSLKNDEISKYIQTAVIDNIDQFKVDSKNFFVNKIQTKINQNDNLSDIESYLYYFNNQSKINQFQQPQIIFAGLTPEQQKISFIKSLETTKYKRIQLQNELKYQILLENGAWMSNNLRFGCSNCAPYLTRQNIPAEPPRHHNFIHLNGQLQMQDIQNKQVANSILHTLLQNYKQQTFIAFLGREEVFDVASEILKFINDGQSFMSHKEQDYFLQENWFVQHNISKDEAIQRLALMNALFEQNENYNEGLDFPFKIDSHDILKYQSYSDEYLKITQQVEFFQDIDMMGVDFDNEKDFIKQDKITLQNIQNAILEQPQIGEYFKTKQYGSKILKCHPLSVLQSDLSFYHIQKKQRE